MPCPSPDHRHRGLFLAATAALVLAAGCATTPPPSGPSPVPGYEGLREDLAGRDLTPLAGRRIVLDPGHGGYFRGALGPNGLTEAEVNLGVSLHLRGLLEWAGAQVWLTRSTDTDFLTPADSSLVGDLAMRVSLSDSLQPDVFLSIHHNSNAAYDPTINETQTYYPLDDDGASLDLARAIHRHLVLNLEITPASIRPGNFHVLRHATVPAVLGEPAMISHPVMAERLSLAASHRIEAAAYFLGLLDYFAGGLPRWSGARVDTVLFGGDVGPDTLAWHFIANGPGPDPDRLQVFLDGTPVPAGLTPSGSSLSWMVPTDLAPRPHVLEVRGANLAGRSTPLRRTLLLPRAAATPAVRITRAHGGQNALVAWSTAGGMPLPRGEIELDGGVRLPVGPDLPSHHLVAPLPTGEIVFHPADGSAPRICSVEVRQLPEGETFGLAERDGHPFVPAAGWRARTGGRGEGPAVIRQPSGPLWIEAAGIAPLFAAEPTAGSWQVRPLLPGLLGKTIVLDPRGGATTTDGTGPLGLRGADLNLAVARETAALLAGAGARVVLTRRDETVPPAVEKVRLAGRERADFFLAIARHGEAGAREVRHHPGSATGEAWAAALARAATSLPAAAGGPGTPAAVTAAPDYLLRHTACPALVWRGEPPSDVAAEWRLGTAGWARAEARSLLLALAEVTGHASGPAELLQPPAALDAIQRAGGPAPERVTWLRLDGNLAWTPLPTPVAGAGVSVDSPQGPALPAAGPHHVLEVRTATAWSLWSLERTTAGWSARRLLAPGEPTP